MKQVKFDLRRCVRVREEKQGVLGNILFRLIFWHEVIRTNQEISPVSVFGLWRQINVCMLLAVCLDVEAAEWENPSCGTTTTFLTHQMFHHIWVSEPIKVTAAGQLIWRRYHLCQEIKPGTFSLWSVALSIVRNLSGPAPDSLFWFWNGKIRDSWSEATLNR